MKRSLSLALGLSILAIAWLKLPLSLAPGPFSAHMALHMAVVALAAPLLALGLAQTRFDPVPHAGELFSAVPASIVELVVVWGWHTPALHHAARHSTLGFVLEQGSFALSALWLWCSAFGGVAAERDRRRGAGILGLLLTSMHMTLLGALIALPPRVLYAHGAHALGHLDHASTSALNALDDQHLGGAIMIVFGGASYLLGGLWLASGLLRQRGGAAPVACTGSTRASASRGTGHLP